MTTHALSRPLRLANPAPMKSALLSSTDHMHTTAYSKKKYEQLVVINNKTRQLPSLSVGVRHLGHGFDVTRIVTRLSASHLA